jgi:hypothetical protein
LQGRKERKVFMKKALLVVAMLLAASQVMADVTITAVNEGTFTLPDGNKAATFRVDYTGTTNVRAFALDVNVDSGCNFWNIRNFKVGENNGTNNGYGIFPGRFRQFINPANPAWGDANGNSNYNPTPPWADPGTTNTGIGFGVMIVEMGYLGATDANKPPMSGTLFRADINAYQFAGTAHLTISADTMRGGVVDKDTNATTTATVTYVGTNFVFPCTPVAIPDVRGKNMTDANTTLAAFTTIVIGYECNNTYAAGLVCRQDSGSQCVDVPVHYWVSTGMCCTIPINEIGQPRATAEPVWTGQGFTLCGTGVVNCAQLNNIITQDLDCCSLPYCLRYTYGIAPTEPNVAGMSRSAAVSALTALGFVVGTDINVPPTATYTTVLTVRGQNPPAGTTGCGTTVNLSVVSYPVKITTAAGSLYVNWVNRNKPQCWAYPRQCRGNADGKKQGSLYWVGSTNLAVLKAAFNKSEATFTGGATSGGVSLICASFDHKKQGSLYWVGSTNLATLKAYFNKAEASVPVCGNIPLTGSTDPNYWYWCTPTGVTCPTGQLCAPAGICPNTP